MSETVKLFRVQDSEGRGPCGDTQDEYVRNISFSYNFYGPNTYFDSILKQPFPYHLRHAFETLDEVSEKVKSTMSIPVTVLEVPK